MRPLRGLRQILFPKIFELSDCFGTFPKMTENARGGCQKKGLLVSTRASSTNVSKPENQKTKKKKKAENQKNKNVGGLVYGHISHSSVKFWFFGCLFVFGFFLFLLVLLVFLVFCFLVFCFFVFFVVVFFVVVFFLFFCWFLTTKR